MEQLKIVEERYSFISETLTKIKELDNTFDPCVIDSAITNCALSIFTVFEDYVSRMFKSYIDIICHSNGKLMDFNVDEIFDMKFKKEVFSSANIRDVVESLHHNVNVTSNDLNNYFYFKHFNEKNFNSIDKKFRRIFNTGNNSYLSNIKLDEILVFEKESKLITSKVSAHSIIISYSTKYRHKIAHDVHNNLLTINEIEVVEENLHYFSQIIRRMNDDFYKIYKKNVQSYINEI